MLFVTMPFSQRVRSRPVTTNFARQLKSKIPHPVRNAANSSSGEENAAAVCAPQYSTWRLADGSLLFSEVALMSRI